MNKKRFMIFIIIIGMLLLSSSSVLGAEDDNTKALDIEKTAIEAISNSPSVKHFDEVMKNVDKYDNESKEYTNAVLSAGRGNLIQALVLNPLLAKNSLDQFTRQKEVNTKTVILDAYSKYIALLKANYSVNIQTKLTDNLKKDSENAKLRLASGLITNNAERLIEINYLKATYQLSRFQNDLDSAYMTINLLTGEDMTQRYTTLMDNNITAYKSPMLVADYVKKAFINRIEVVNAQDTVDIQKKVFNNTPSDWIVDYDFYGQKYRYDIDNSQNNLDEAKISVQLEIKSGYKKLEVNTKALESQQANYDFAESNYEAAQIEFNNSMITLNKFQGVEIAKAQAKMNLKNAELDAWLQATKLNFASEIGPGLN